MAIKGEILLAQGRQPRRRFSAAEKISENFRIDVG